MPKQPNLNQMMKQVQQMQAEMMKAQEALKSEVVEASAGGGMVTVKITGDLQLREIRIDPVDRRQRTAKHVVPAVVLVRALHRDDVTGVFDHADHVCLAALVLADPADRTDREVEAGLAQAHRGLHLTDRVGQPERLLVGDAEDVEGEPLRGALPDPGQAPELGDEPVDGCCEQGG